MTQLASNDALIKYLKCGSQKTDMLNIAIQYTLSHFISFHPTLFHDIDGGFCMKFGRRVQNVEKSFCYFWWVQFHVKVSLFVESLFNTSRSEYFLTYIRILCFNTMYFLIGFFSYIITNGKILTTKCYIYSNVILFK